MKKSVYLAALAALTLTACSDSQDDIFDQSAAERLEQYKLEYADALTADGGLWSMEYFCNPDEKGYVFVMKFDKNGSVEISADHQWIGDVFKQETSLWKMIADNGPVLSFNSYNSLFHVFSDPANITGSGAPVGDDGQTDIDETGFGHEGDYEFQVMELSEDGQTVRLLGKKRMYEIFLHRLDANTNPQEYLQSVKDATARVSKKFNDMTLTDVEGNKYRLFNLYSSIPSIYPLDGDAVSQTVKANGIFTVDGFRFMEPLEVKKADDSTIELTKLFFNEDGSMSGENFTDLRSISPFENIVRQDMSWILNKESLSGKIKNLYEDANNQIKDVLGSKESLGDIELTYASVAGKISPQLVTRIGSRVCRDYIEYNIEKDENGNVVPSNELDFSITGGNNTSIKYDEQLPAYKALKDYLAGSFTLTVNNPLLPDVITLTDNNDSSTVFDLKVK